MSNVVQRSFAAGEVAPALYTRVDQTKYQTGLRTCRNFQVRKQGGVQNRPGTEFVCEVKDSTQPVRLLDFVFNDNQTYILEFGNQYIRFVQNGALLQVSGVAAYNNATAYVVGDLVVNAGVNYYCIAPTTGHAPPNGTYWYALTGTIYEIPSPYVTADLGGLYIAQSADVITIVHPNYTPMDLSRFGQTRWTLVAETFVPGILAPTGLGFAATGGTATPPVYWTVTAINAAGEESVAATSAGPCAVNVDVAHPCTLSWTVAAGAVSYNLYRSIDNATWGYIGSALMNSFVDYGVLADTQIAPPILLNPFPGTNNYPSVVGYYQQRRYFANTNNKPETAWASKSANFANFSASSPSQADDALSFTLAGQRVNIITHLLDLNQLLMMTKGTIWSINGDQSGVVTPGQINPQNSSYHGVVAGYQLKPIPLGITFLFVQARGTIVRDLTHNPIYGYMGNDLTIFSPHLFEKFSIVEWGYAEIPQSIIWMLRSDGAMIGLTYVSEQQVWAWHRHDTLGVFENLRVIPEGTEDRIYVVVNRTINGVTKRYIERFNSRIITDEKLAPFADCSVVFDGRNTNTTILSSGMGTVNGTTWDDHDLNLQLSSNGNIFQPSDVGNAIFMTAADGSEVRFTIWQYDSPTFVHARPNRTVPLDLQNNATIHWAKAVVSLSGLGYLEGQAVSVYGDSFVVASPNNSDVTVRTVTGGVLTLDKPYSVIRVGLPYISDFETLDLDLPQGQSLKDRGINITGVGLFIEEGRGGWSGPSFPAVDDDPLDGLMEFKTRYAEPYDSPVDEKTDFIQANTKGTWNGNGRVVVRQVDPLPLTISSVTPQGYIPPG